MAIRAQWCLFVARLDQRGMEAVLVSLEGLLVAFPASIFHAQRIGTLAFDRLFLLAVGLGVDIRVAVLALGLAVLGRFESLGRDMQGKLLVVVERLLLALLVVALEAGLGLFRQPFIFGVNRVSCSL